MKFSVSIVNYINCSLDFRNTEVVVRKCISEQVFLNFAMFTRKYLQWSLFLINMQACNFIKQRLQHVCFLVNLRIIFKKTLPEAAYGKNSLSLLHFRTMNGANSQYVLPLRRLFPILSISFFFILFFVWILLLFGFEVSRQYFVGLSILKRKQQSCFQVPRWSLKGLVASALFSN